MSDEKTFTQAEVDAIAKQAHSRGAADYAEQARASGLHDDADIIVERDPVSGSVDLEEYERAQRLVDESGGKRKIIYRWTQRKDEQPAHSGDLYQVKE